MPVDDRNLASADGGPGAIEVVTFDYWDTLVRAEPPPFRQARLDVWAETLHRHDRSLPVDRIESVLRLVFEDFTAAWQSNRQYTATDAARAALERFEREGEPPFGPRLTDELVAAFAGAGSDVVPELTPAIAATLDALRSAGVRLGIVCDVGLTPSVTLRRALDAHGLLEAFDHWAFSDEVGVYKPDPAIFEHALEGLGAVPPQRAAHVGDLRRTDIAGAKAMGMTAVRYRGVADDTTAGPEGDIVLDDHADLPALLLL